MSLARKPGTSPVLSKKQTALVARGQIGILEEMLNKLPDEDKIDPEAVTTHHFAPGVYARMIFVPKGKVIVGKIHRHITMNIVCKGKIMVQTEQGMMSFEGPCIVNSDPGIKKAAYAVEDTWWINIHVTNETDLGKIEDEFIIEDYAQLEYKEE
jgi:hypothetical protein